MAIVTGTAGRDRLNGTADNDTLSGLAEKDTLSGFAGDDLLDGGAGADTLIGGRGNDVFRVDQGNDRPIENAGEGRDRVESTQSFRLPDNVEDLTLLGTARANGKGNALDNVIIGNAARNTLSGMAGNDRLEGGAGDDRLLGGVGVDMMIGGAGRDQYQVDNAGDVVVEMAGGGRDHVVTSISFALPDNVERLTLNGVADLDGTGNAAGNVIRGNRGTNTLAGGAGNDLLEGRGGTDTLLGEEGNDTLTVADLGFARVDGGSGTDLLRLLASGNVDLTTLVPRLQSIERIDLAGTAGGTTLMVGAADAIALSEAGDMLLVRGQASDVVAFDVADGFQAAGSESRGGTIFDAFVSGPARVLVQRGVAVTGVNTPPAAMADSASAGENAMIAIDVLANDSDPGDVLTVSVGAAASAGGAGLSVVMNQVVYDPGTAFDFLRAGETASDTFTYTISDAVGATESAIVTVSVNGQNDAPAAAADSVSTGENAAVSINVSVNDGDADAGDLLTVSVGAASANGAGLSIVMNQVVYDPGTAFDFLRDGETASDTFIYTVTDSAGATASATVTVTVNGRNDGPSATADSVSTSENAAVSIDVLANDRDRDAGDTLTVTVGQASVGGASLSVVANQVVYDPGTSFDFLRDGETASDTFTYTINDADGATASAVVTVTVTGDPLGDLGALDAHDGFRIDGTFPYDLSGSSVSGAGDINGDGFEDLIIGAPSANRPTEGPYDNAGAAYVIYGRASGFGPVIPLSTLDGLIGSRFDGAAQGDLFGDSVSSAGDVNGDGFVDFIVGAPGADVNGDRSGASYVIFGTTSGFGAEFSLSAIDGVNGFGIGGEQQCDQLYANNAVSTAGDFNGDGLADLIVGAIGAERSPQEFGFDAGAAYVVFGRTGASSAVSLSALDGANGFKLVGVDPTDRTGISVSTAGDINGDGFADIVVGADYADPNGERSGSTYVVFGGASGFASSLSLSALDGENGFRIDGVALYDYSGASVSSAGDINGDGIADIVVGARFAGSGGVYAGAAYVVFGHTSGFGSVLALSSLDGTNGFRLEGVDNYDFAGFSVSSAGDINGDGFDDLIVGAIGTDTNGDLSGSAYLVFGRANGFGSAMSLGALGPTTGIRLDGGAAYDRIGYAVSGAGDIDGDGFDDVILGAENVAGPGGAYSGSSFLIFGRDFAGTVDLAGGDGNDVLIANNGAAQPDILVGGRGSDALTGDGGLDVLIGGQGDDELAVADLSFRRVDGGTGFDELFFLQAGMIDLAAVRGHIRGVELFDVANGQANTVGVRLADILALGAQNIDAGGTTFDNVVVIEAGAGENDQVNLATVDGWTEGANVTVEGETFRVFTVNSVTLAVDSDATIAFV